MFCSTVHAIISVIVCIILTTVDKILYCSVDTVPQRSFVHLNSCVLAYDIYSMLYIYCADDDLADRLYQFGYNISRPSFRDAVHYSLTIDHIGTLLCTCIHTLYCLQRFALLKCKMILMYGSCDSVHSIQVRQSLKTGTRFWSRHVRVRGTTASTRCATSSCAASATDGPQ